MHALSRARLAAGLLTAAALFAVGIERADAQCANLPPLDTTMTGAQKTLPELVAETELLFDKGLRTEFGTARTSAIGAELQVIVLKYAELIESPDADRRRLLTALLAYTQKPWYGSINEFLRRRAADEAGFADPVDPTCVPWQQLADDAREALFRIRPQAEVVQQLRADLATLAKDSAEYAALAQAIDVANRPLTVPTYHADNWGTVAAAGCPMCDFFERNVQPQAIVTQPSFWSSNIGELSPTFRGRVRWVVRNPASGRDISDITPFRKTEKEFLFMPGQQLKIEEIQVEVDASHKVNIAPLHDPNRNDRRLLDSARVRELVVQPIRDPNSDDSYAKPNYVWWIYAQALGHRQLDIGAPPSLPLNAAVTLTYAVTDLDSGTAMTDGGLIATTETPGLCRVDRNLLVTPVAVGACRVRGRLGAQNGYGAVERVVTIMITSPRGELQRKDRFIVPDVNRGNRGNTGWTNVQPTNRDETRFVDRIAPAPQPPVVVTPAPDRNKVTATRTGSARPGQNRGALGVWVKVGDVGVTGAGKARLVVALIGNGAASPTVGTVLRVASNPNRVFQVVQVDNDPDQPYLLLEALDDNDYGDWAKLVINLVPDPT